MKQEQTLPENPREYIYTAESKIEVPGGFLSELIGLADQLVQSELKTETKFKYVFINKDTNKSVKTPKPEDIESGKVIKIVDYDRTIYNPTFEHSLTEKGIPYMNLKLFLEQLHQENIQKGIAVHYNTLNDNQEKQG